MDVTLPTKIAEITIGILNLSFLLGNIAWQKKFKDVANQKELIEMITAQNKAKDEVIATLKESKDRYKHQYMNQLAINEKIKGQIDTYQKLHNTT
jgi:hypothetical protein